MKRGRRAAFALGLAFLSSLALGMVAGCGAKGGDTVQSNTKDSASRTFTTLSQVVVNDSYTTNALSKEYDYLVSLDSDKLLYWFRLNADLDPKATASYGGGWEGELIGGHTLGHYLSALAQGYVNAGLTAAQHDTLKEIIDYIVDELKACQDNATAAGAQEGFLWGARKIGTTPETQFNNVELNRADIATQAWVPWYTLHKIVAGLYDVTVLTGNATAKEVLLSLCDWVYARTQTWTDSIQRTVLSIEYGGMNDILYSVYALTGEEKYAVAAHCFDEETLFADIMSERVNYLDGLHANTTIPKILGALNRYVTCQGKTIEGKEVEATYYLGVAERFFERVLSAHTYITGGNSEWEHFGADNILNAERTNCNCETCNTYNMLKLARMLFAITGEKQYLDYYENAYYNAILSSQNPDTGMTTYFQPMASGYFKVYSTPDTNFWCCTGSGMESMTKLSDSIYYDAGNATYVSLYLSSEYTGNKVSITQTADLENSDEVNFKITKGSTILRLRVPDWSDTVQVEKNGGAVAIEGDEEFVSVSVKKGDQIKLTLHKQVRAYNLQDGANVYAFRYGPFVLSAELGNENMNNTSTEGVNVTVPDVYKKCAISVDTYSVPANSVAAFMEEIDAHMTRADNNKFTLACNNGTLTYSLHYRQYTQRYAIYLEFAVGEVETKYEPWEWVNTDTRQPGYGQYEKDLADEEGAGSQGSTSDTEAGGTSRFALAGKSFTYSAVKVEKGALNRLVFYFAKADNGKSIKITTGDTTLYENSSLSYTGSEKIYAVEIEIPESVVAASDGTVPVTVSGVDGAQSARICSFVYSQYFENHTLYFVDCGDYTPTTVSEGDHFGRYNSVTDQIYGADPVTGKQWGIVDTHPTNIGGTQPSGVAGGGVYSNSTWAYEYASTTAELSKTDTNRYTKNQSENGVARNLHYKFELEDGEYQVKVYLANPWNNAANANVSANGTTMIENAACDRELYFNVTVSGGSLALDFTSNSLCINLCYIMIVAK